MIAVDPLQPVRLAGARLLMWLFWLNVPLLCLMGWAIGSSDGGFAALAAVAIALLPTVAVMRGELHGLVRAAMAITTMAFPALYLFLMRGHPWQMDMHMTFFAALATLTVLLDRRALLAAAGVTAIHHLILNYYYPASVFASASDLPRVLLHALIVILQTAMLLWIVTRLHQLIRGQAAEKARSDRLRVEADEAKARAEDALTALEKAQLLADHQRVIEEAARRAEEAADRRRLVADALEARLGAVVADLGQLSRQLSTSKQWLFDLLDRTTDRSTDLRAAHARAEIDVRAVAQDTERLAASIHGVGHSADHMRHSAHQGAAAARALTPEMQALTTTVDAASTIVALISSIAAQSRTLSFNAGIEAARAQGDMQGFGIVAGEMKSLALQTAQATQQIDRYLDDIRYAARSVTGAIDMAARSAETADSSAGAIAQEVAEQISATSEIAAATEEMARHIASAASLADALNGALAEAQGAMTQTDVAASALSARSAELQDTVRTVLHELRAA